MQIQKELRKGLAVVVILLFIGIAVAPSINVTVVKAAADSNNTYNSLNEKSKVSCQYFLLRGVEKIEREISLQDSEHLSKLMDSSDIKAIASELVRLGLVPSSISSEQLKNLISGEYGKKEFKKYYDKYNRVIPGESDAKKNLFCTINGEANSYISRNLRAQLVAYILVYPSIAFLLLDFFLHFLPWYPLKAYIIGGFPGYWEYGLFGALSMILYEIAATLLPILDNRPVKLSVFQEIQMSRKYDSQILAHLNTTGINGKWELYGNRIDLSLIGFFGIWFSIQNPQDELFKFRGFSLFINAESSN